MYDEYGSDGCIHEFSLSLRIGTQNRQLALPEDKPRQKSQDAARAHASVPPPYSLKPLKHMQSPLSTRLPTLFSRRSYRPTRIAGALGPGARPSAAVCHCAQSCHGSESTGVARHAPSPTVA